MVDEGRRVYIRYENDLVIKEDIDELWDDLVVHEPSFVRMAMVKAKFDVEKAKRIAGWIIELFNFVEILPDGRGAVDADLAKDLATEWCVEDILAEELIGLFVDKFVPKSDGVVGG